MAKKKKSKSVNVKMMERDTHPDIYTVLNELVSENHHHLIDARIGLAWRYGWNEDQDGRLKLGQAKKLSDFDREFRTESGEELDLVILLNFEAWNKAGFTEAHQRALLDHELCHFELATDENGEPKLDERNRQIYRLRGHDVEEFTEIVARHGIWKSDLEKFAKQAAAKLPLFEKTQMKMA